MLTRARTRRPGSDIAIGLALLAILLANTVVTGGARRALVYAALATVAVIAVARKSLWQSLLLAAVALAAVVLTTTI